MKMEFLTKKDTCEFDSIEVGDIFKIGDEFFLKIDPTGLDCRNVNCIRLSNYRPAYIYDADTLVTCVDSKLTIYENKE